MHICYKAAVSILLLSFSDHCCIIKSATVRYKNIITVYGPRLIEGTVRQNLKMESDAYFKTSSHVE